MAKKFNEFIKLYERGFKLVDISSTLSLSYSTCKRYKIKYIQSKNNIDCTISHNIHKKKLSNDDIQFIINFYVQHVPYFNFKHFYEHFVLNQMGYDISYSSLKRYFRQNLILSPKSNKKTKCVIKKELKLLNLNPHLSKSNIISLNTSTGKFLDKNNIHPRMSKAKYFGEIVEADASIHQWYPGITASLHLFVDKSTSKILGAHFSEKECLNSYLVAFKQVLLEYGIPFQLVTDKRTVFTYSSKKQVNFEPTKFENICQKLGILLKSYSVPQKKGTVERVFGTLQSRLVSEFRLYDINTIDKMNDYLKDFIKTYNETFSSDNTLNSFVSQIDEEKIDEILCIYIKRKISRCCISLNGDIYTSNKRR